ncbi:hypothetical protein [Nostoc sp. TCL26-01]|uniref:hypothetical protein n=1 Tax=Nostoc sp. TCL26-01 TaxID=2576904 RepID=UPI0015C124C6|nr:hypothetical protein [Nostoc sp. TCL26-01]QLE56105.1 hypothetical protein FD725_11525 [Nostoc sp. TCL26-01]
MYILVLGFLIYVGWRYTPLNLQFFVIYLGIFINLIEQIITYFFAMEMFVFCLLNIDVTHILHQATGSRGYTGKTRLRGFQTLDVALVRVGGLCLYSRDF